MEQTRIKTYKKQEEKNEFIENKMSIKVSRSNTEVNEKDDNKRIQNN